MLGQNKQEQDASINDINVANAAETPGDTISSLAWAPNLQQRFLAVSAWDSKIRVYDTVIQNMQQKGFVQKMCLDVEDPCLSVNWQDDMTKLFAGCINNTVKAVDMQSGNIVNVGQHDGPVKDVYWMQSAGLLCTLSFDKTIRFWDLRQAQPAAGFQLGHKVYCSDMFFPNIVMGLSEEKILVVNIPNIQQMLGKTPLDYIDSPLGAGSQLTAVGFFADGSGIGVASHDGRANLSKMEADNMGRPKLNNVMTFKCHKVDQGTAANQQTLYPVHGIGFHSKAKHFVYTAGGEGNIFFWDYNAKNKTTGLSFNRAPVTRAKMSPDGALLAYALGYDWAKGIEGYMSCKPKLCAHIMQESELVYKK